MLHYPFIRLLSTFSAKPTFLVGFLCVVLISNTNARVHQYETTRLKSTAGAGAASFLMDEATILNPASLAFFSVSSLYYQKMGSEHTPQSDTSTVSTVESDQTGYIISDAKGELSGSVAYLKQIEKDEERKTIGISMASPLSKDSMFGVTYKIVEETELRPGETETISSEYKQTSFGISHAISPNFSLGIVAIDPFRTRKEDTRAIIGIQYIYKDFISVMLDTGADYNQDLSKTLLYRSAIQFKIFNDFYLRAGTFDDKGLRERGNGAGIGWVSPRFVFDLAVKNTKVLENKELLRDSETIKESSFSLSYRF